MTAFEGKRDQSWLAGSRGALRSPVINLVGAFGGLRGGKGKERERESEGEIDSRKGRTLVTVLLSFWLQD